MSAKQSAVDRGYDALEELIAKGQKINKNAVAKLAEFSHTNFYKEEFRELQEAIEDAEDKRQRDLLSNEVEKLKEEVLELKDKLKKEKAKAKKSSNDGTELKLLLAKLTECYRLVDELKRDNADLQNEIAHLSGTKEKVIRVNEQTGEVLTGIFKD